MVRRKIIPLLLAGGAGARLWPVSRDAMPKQFLPLVGERSTYQQALARVSTPDLFAPPIVMTANDFRFFARAQAEEIGVDATIVLEPMRRDSAPAVAAGAQLALRRDPDAIVLALAADHVIVDESVFHAACAAAREAAAAGYIVTFGIPPSAPKTSTVTSVAASRSGSTDAIWSPPSWRNRMRRRPWAMCRRFFVELGQFPVPRRHVARRTRALRTGDGAGGRGCGRAR